MLVRVALPLIPIVIYHVSYVVDVIHGQIGEEFFILGQLCVVEAPLEVFNVDAVVWRRLLEVFFQIVDYNRLAEVTPQQAKVFDGVVTLKLTMLPR